MGDNRPAVLPQKHRNPTEWGPRPRKLAPSSRFLYSQGKAYCGVEGVAG